MTINSDLYNFYVSVEDTGIGIPQDSIDKIYERFYRVDKSRSREVGGTGLGLSITKSIVLQHHGSIDVQSIEGEGTKFTVTVPLSYVSRPAELRRQRERMRRARQKRRSGQSGSSSAVQVSGKKADVNTSAVRTAVKDAPSQKTAAGSSSAAGKKPAAGSAPAKKSTDSAWAKKTAGSANGTGTTGKNTSAKTSSGRKATVKSAPAQSAVPAAQSAKESD